MGNYENNVYLDNKLIKKIEVKKDIPLSFIRTSLNNTANFDNKSYEYYFLSKDADIWKSDSNFTDRDVVANYYKIKIISKQFSFKVNIIFY